jgi:hypothetical protein
MNTFSFDILNTPTSYCQKQEQEYRKLRETKIHFIEFIYPNMEGTVYDFKIQEKGDNDFYWLNCKNGKFYVIPESILIEKVCVSDNCDNKCKQHLYVSPTNNNTKMDK